MSAEADDRANTIEKIRAETHWLTLAQIAELPLVKWKREGRIFSIEIDDTQAYPSYQFDENFQPLPVIAEVLKAFKSESDSWKIAAWFHFPNGYINVDTPEGRHAIGPKDALDQPEKVMHAVQSRAGTYVT